MPMHSLHSQQSKFFIQKDFFGEVKQNTKGEKTPLDTALSNLL